MRILFFFFGLLFIFSAKAQQTTDMPRRGEGITSFLKRNNRPGRTYYKAFLELNKKRLRGKKELQYGVRYVLPPLSEDCGGKGDATSSGSPVLHEPLFGKELAQVKVTSSRLKGACFYVVSGHGGPDPGAIGRVGRTELHEDEYAYDVALRYILLFKIRRMVSVTSII